VRERDADRYLSDLFAPDDSRRHLFALHAFNAEVARIRDVISDPMPGEIRLQWWRDAIASGDGGGHPVATALNATIREASLPSNGFDSLLSARTFDLYDDPMPSLNDLEGYAGETSSILIQLAALILSKEEAPAAADVAGHGGVAYALSGLMRALPAHAARGQMYMPADLMSAFGVEAADVFAGRNTPALAAMLRELRDIARRHLAPALAGMKEIDRRLSPAFLPILLVEPRLKLMDAKDFDPFRNSAELTAWRRQWLLWRGARS
jgi:phytoene synthase